MSIIEDLYFGEYSANEKDFNEAEAYEKVHNGIKYFRDNLLQEDINIFNRLIDGINELGTINDFHSYKKGVRFGVDLMSEIYSEKPRCK